MYLVDANVLIQAKNLYYDFDFCPAFWEWLDERRTQERVYSVAKVGEELLRGGDRLAHWAADRREFFLPVDELVTGSMRQTSAWANQRMNEGRYNNAAIDDFLDAADYYLVAHAHAHNLIVVTNERSTNQPTKIKIPDACQALTVRCISPFEMLREEGARFVLGPAIQPEN